MENDLRWLPTKEASAFLGVSSQFLKKNRDIKDGFLLEEKHYICLLYTSDAADE